MDFIGLKKYSLPEMNESPRKLLVRDTKSRKFLRSTGRWTKKAEAAFQFPNLINAIHACLGKGLREVELILRFDGDAHDRCIRLQCA